MSIFRPQALADGLITNSLAALFTASADIGTYVKSLTLYNSSATEQTVLLYINMSGTDRLWKRFVLAVNEHADALGGGESVILENGDIIKAVTTTTNVVSYTIGGVEESTT